MTKARKKHGDKRAAPKPKRRNRIFLYRKLYAAIILILLIMAGAYAARIASLKTDEAEATTKFQAALDKKARLENELNYIDDPAYIEHQARTRLRMVKPGEIYYVLPKRDAAEETVEDAEE
jgi:cell division protein FtsB